MKFPFVYKNLAHQEEEWRLHRDTPRRGYLWDPGLGKSKSGTDKMAYLYMTDKIDTVVIMAKKGEYTNWKYVELPEHMPTEERLEMLEETGRDADDWKDVILPAHMPNGIEYVCEVYRSGLKEWEKQKLRDLVKPSYKLRILNINIESMGHEGEKVARAFIASRRKGLMFILDESTTAKSHKSARAKAVYKLASFAQYRIIMTGTFTPQSPLDVWGQVKVLGEGLLGTTSYYAYKATYCREEMQYYGPNKHFKKIVGTKNLDDLNRRIKTFASIRTKEECLDLPPKIYKKFHVDMTEEQMTMYTDMRDMAIAEVGENIIVESTSALEILSKMDQIAVGQIKLDDGSYRILPNNRVESVLTQCGNTNAKGIIWCNYKGMLEHLYEQFKLEFGPEAVGRFYGGVKDEERELTVKQFQNEHQLRFIVANQQSLGYGRTLTRGTENHYVSNGYNLEHRLQSEDRTHRIGQSEHVLYGDYFCPGTVNEKIYVALRNKRNVMSEILGTPLRQWI